jgi:hypothetical protein
MQMAVALMLVGNSKWPDPTDELFEVTSTGPGLTVSCTPTTAECNPPGAHAMALKKTCAELPVTTAIGFALLSKGLPLRHAIPLTLQEGDAGWAPFACEKQMVSSPRELTVTSLPASTIPTGESTGLRGSNDAYVT